MTARWIFICAACGEMASTVTLVEPGQPEPGLAPEPLFASTLPEARLSIRGGPVSMSIAFVPHDRVAEALEGGDAAELFAIDPEFAPFWCPACRSSYCGEHYRTWQTFDDGFYDATYGACPKGHQRVLDD